MSLKVKDSNIFKIPGNQHMLHMCTISYSASFREREFVAMLCISGPHKGNMYIEEAVLESKNFSTDVWANFKFIDDDNLAEDLFRFCESKGLLDIKKRTEELGETGRLKWLL